MILKLEKAFEGMLWHSRLVVLLLLNKTFLIYNYLDTSDQEGRDFLI